MIFIVYFNRLQYHLYYTNKYYQHELFSIFTLNNVANEIIFHQSSYGFAVVLRVP